jgi:shikimate kinase
MASAANGGHLALVGLMGSGKSSVGRVLARRLDRRFVDLDKRIVADAGLTIPEIFERDGEAGFRRLEADALGAVLADDEPVVLATGGGVVVRPENVDALRAGATVVWLRGTPETLAGRVGDGKGRPLLTSGDESIVDRLRRLSGERDHAYRVAAHLVVDIDRRTRDQVVDEVLAQLATP